ncbi:M24 family metallopeptidase [Brevibacterium sp. K11IcPPYGO002]|uniref:M24 family metallopeptidase n=1 Tax=Brevibacterium sp. K11IcPPYGO002 TaxID=3058837 RepID=UPI003D813840
MIKLTTDKTRLADSFGLDAQKSLLFSAIRLDSSPLVAPLIADTTDGEVLLVRQQEQGNALSAGVPKERMRFYAPWVTIDPRIVADTPASASLATLVEELAEGEQVGLDSGVVMKHYSTLSKSLDVVADKQPTTPVVAYEIDTAAVLERFSRWRELGAETATRLIADVEHLDGLSKEIQSQTDTRYSALQSMAKDRGLDAVVISAPPNFSEVVGTQQSEGQLAVWSSQDEKLYVLAPETAHGVSGTPIGRFAGFGAAAVALAHGNQIGVEEEWIATGLALELEAEGAVLNELSTALGHWRDVRDHEDLGFQIVAARCSVFAIEEALKWAEESLAAGLEFTELDIYARYVDKIVEFRTENVIPFAVEPYFTNLHSSNRMLFPGPPVDFPINDDTKCIQLDAGVRITFDGITVATSDMARSLPRTDGAKEAYEFFFDVVREGIIGQLRPGVVCEDVHAGTLDYLAPHLGRMIEIGMLGEEVDFNTEYRKRNVGHLMGKQESFANELRPGYKHVLDVGSFGAAEIPWRYGNVAIGTEDLWYIGADRTYILSKR